MIGYMLGFRRPPPKTLGEIISTFTQTAADLRLLSGDNSARISEVDLEIDALAEEREGLIVENQKADSIRAKIEQLVS